MTCAAHLALAEHWPALERQVARSWTDLRLEGGAADVVRYVHAYPRVNGNVRWHCFRFAFDAGYPGLPPSVLCVHPLTREPAQPNRTPWWPQVAGNPYVNVQPTADPPYFCFPYTLEYIRTHGTNSDVRYRWDVATHTVSATVNQLRRMLRPPFYTGYVDPSFEETLRVGLAASPSPYSPT